MTREEEQILSILDAIASNSKASQRDLSKATGLNLATVNFLLRKLAEKGFVKLRNVSKNPNKLGYLYLLTPGGLLEKSRLTVRFASRTWKEYTKTIERLRVSLIALAESGGCHLVLVGANEVADMVVEAGAKIDGINIVGIVDPNYAGETRRDIKVVAHARHVAFDRAIFCVPTETGAADMAQRTGIEENKVWRV
jgi:EPS-associated MarR family transcriptional regulator